MNYYANDGQLDFPERYSIEIGILKKSSFKQIAKTLKRHPSTISHEIKENRTFVRGAFPFGKDCVYAHRSHVSHICGSKSCTRNCCQCLIADCTKICKKHKPYHCSILSRVPYVCNACISRRECIKNKYFYSAKNAQAASEQRRSSARQGCRISGDELKMLDELLVPLIKKGQPLSHIYAEHEAEIPLSLRSLYNYIDYGYLSVKNIDLRRKVGYRARRRKKGTSASPSVMEYRKGRTYADFENSRLNESRTVEMDTVRGLRAAGKCLLTMIFRSTNIMLLFLLPDGKADSVKRAFDYLENGLGPEVFKRLFPFILTDNGSEFKRVDDLELTSSLEYRTHIYYCDPMSSWQKGCLEKNHEFIRYAIPKGRSFNSYSDEDITMLMNHINSVKRKGLGNKSPYELVDAADEDMHKLMALMRMQPVPPDEVCLKPELFSKHN